jgi:hypothetical protein
MTKLHPLHEAVSTDPCDTVQLKHALQTGHKPNSLNSHYLTPLHILAKAECKQQNQDGIQILVQAGADCTIPLNTPAATRPCDILYLRGKAGQPVQLLGQILWKKEPEWKWSNFIVQSDTAHAFCGQMIQEIEKQIQGYNRWSRWRPWFRAAERHAAVLELEAKLKEIKHHAHHGVKHVLHECETPFPGGTNPLHTLRELQTAVKKARNSVTLESCGVRGIGGSDWYQRNKMMDDKLSHEIHRLELIMRPADAKTHCLEILKKELRRYEEDRRWFCISQDPSRAKIIEELNKAIEQWQAEPTKSGTLSNTFSSMKFTLEFQIKSITNKNTGIRGPRFSRLRNHLQTALEEVDYFYKVYGHQQKLRPQILC